MTPEQRRRFGDHVEELKASGQRGSKNDRGDFTYAELEALAREFLAESRREGGIWHPIRRLRWPGERTRSNSRRGLRAWLENPAGGRVSPTAMSCRYTLAPGSLTVPSSARGKKGNGFSARGALQGRAR